MAAVNGGKEYAISVRRWFWGFCSLHLLLWTLIPALVRNNVPFDTVEGIVWGNQLQWGYDKHPPLAAWLSALVTHLGGAVGWPVYLISQVAVIAAFWAVFRLAQKFLTPLQALISVMLLEAIMYYGSSLTLKFHPTTLMTPLWAITMLVFYNTLKRPNIGKWLWVGVLAGLCLMAKYQSGLLFVAMFAMLLITTEGRKSFRQPGFYLAFIPFFIIIAPNMFWLMHHSFSEIFYATSIFARHQYKLAILNHTLHPLMFFANQVLLTLPMIVVALPLFFAQRDAATISKFDWQYILVLGLGPFVLTLLFSMVTGSHLRLGWATPYFVLNGVILMAIIRPIITKRIFVVTLILVAILFFGQLFGRAAYIKYGPKYLHHMHHYPDANFPGKLIANDLTNIWHKKYHTKLPYVAGDHYLVVNIVAYSPDKPIPYLQWSTYQSPWINEKQLRRQGAIFAWFEHDSNNRYYPPNLTKIKKRFPRAIFLGDKSYSWDTKHIRPEIIGVAILPPTK